MENLNLDEQILNILKKERYVEESKLFSYLSNSIPKKVVLENIKHLVSEGEVKIFRVYDIRCNETTFIALSQYGYEVWEELKVKGYRINPPKIS